MIKSMIRRTIVRYRCTTLNYTPTDSQIGMVDHVNANHQLIDSKNNTKLPLNDIRRGKVKSSMLHYKTPANLYCNHH